jgi:O-antigen ligase/polysaccharide polymerase Wzy-like membrane protein
VTASALQLLGMLVACGAAAVALLARDPRVRFAAAALALVAAPALVAGDIWHSTRLVDLRHHPATLAAAIATVAIAVAVAAAVFRRFPWTFPVGLFATLPLRVPVQVAGQTAHLLIPLYLVIAGGLACFAYGALVGSRGDRGTGLGSADAGGRLDDWPAAVWLYRVLAVTLVLYAIQSAYSEDVSNAIENACFFLVPFAVMLMLLGEVRWTRSLLGRILIAVVGMALLFAGVAFVEYAVRDLILSRGNLLDSNQLHLYFRVNSLFYDPNIFGRDLALVLVALGAYLAWARGTAAALAAGAAAGILLAALALSYSITSFVALFAGLVVVAALRWGIRWALAGGALAVVCGALVLVVIGTAHSDVRVTESGSEAARGQVDLVKGGVRLARHRPIWGWGSGSFGAAFSRHIERAKTTVSHTEPITVAAEQGAIGLIAYLALVVLALVVLLSGASSSAGLAATAACFVAIFVHSLGYAAFTVDPATWALIGLGLALRRADPTEVAGDRDASGPPIAARPAAV